MSGWPRPINPSATAAAAAGARPASLPQKPVHAMRRVEAGQGTDDRQAVAGVRVEPRPPPFDLSRRPGGGGGARPRCAPGPWLVSDVAGPAPHRKRRPPASRRRAQRSLRPRTCRRCARHERHTCSNHVSLRYPGRWLLASREAVARSTPLRRELTTAHSEALAAHGVTHRYGLLCERRRAGPRERACKHALPRCAPICCARRDLTTLNLLRRA
jgi:hypothetical protein